MTTEAAKCSFPWKVHGKEIKGCVGGVCNTEDGKQGKCDMKVCPAWCSYFGCTCQGRPRLPLLLLLWVVVDIMLTINVPRHARFFLDTGLSQCREVNHNVNYGKADDTEKAFWGENGCKTRPDAKFKTCEDYVKTLKDL